MGVLLDARVSKGRSFAGNPGIDGAESGLYSAAGAGLSSGGILGAEPGLPNAAGAGPAPVGPGSAPEG